MKIIKRNIMRGPNYWSSYRKNIIVLKLDLEEFKEIPSNKIPNFVKSIKSLIPSLFHHQCSVHRPGGFFERLKKGTLMGHVVEHVALELQTLAGMECGYGRARETYTPGIYNIIYSYQIPEAGVRAGEMAVEIVTALANQKPYLHLEEDINELKEIYADERLGPSTESILNEARKRNIPVTELNSKTIMLGYGSQQKIISATLDGQTSVIGSDIVSDKKLTKEILANQYIPVPEGFVVRSLEDLEDKMHHLAFPWVIKPRFANHGRGVTTNIFNIEQAIEAYKIAKTVSDSIIVERYIEGFDFRFLIINYKLVAAAKRLPPIIVGDGKSTIQQLINAINEEPGRGEAHENYLTKVKIDETTLNILKAKNLSLLSILPKNETLCLKHTANISSGGKAIDVTEEVHPHNVFLLERVARLVNLNVCGIDVIAKDVTQPFDSENSAVLEVNAAPGFRMHLSPAEGIKRNVAKPFVDMLFPKNSTARIPLIAITGTNGKTTVARLVAHIANQGSKKVGLTTTDGIYIDNRMIYAGDCSGPRSTLDVLSDPLVDYAVLECARGGIIRSGLGFDQCSVSIVTNISSDHLGLEGIYTIEDLAKVKSVVPHSTSRDGYAILNADDPLVYDMRYDLACNVALFAMSPTDAIQKHCENGGLACFIKNDHIYICDDHELTKIAKVSEIPLTFRGTSDCMKSNLLPAVLASWVNNFTAEQICTALMNFYPTPENLPGRFNLFRFKECQLMLDYAHNENAYRFIRDYLNQIKAKKKIGIIAGTGDRRSEDIWKTGYYAAQIFDEIIIRHDEDSRGRTNEEISELIIQGIKEVNEKADVKIISDEFAALNYAMSSANAGTFIYYFPDKVLKSIDFIKKKYANYSVSVDATVTNEEIVSYAA